MSRKIWKSIGLMSGTSMDGVDAAIITTDGYKVLEEGPSITLPYSKDFRRLLENLIAGKGDLTKIETELTLEHSKAVFTLRLAKNRWLAPLLLLKYSLSSHWRKRLRSGSLEHTSSEGSFIISPT